MDEQSNISNLASTHTESTHLLVSPSLSSSVTKSPCRNNNPTSSDDNNHHSMGHDNFSGTATKGATILNIMKTCMGTGTLALPFACQQGGILLNTFGLLAIASWNLYSVQRLCQSWHYLPSSSVGLVSSSSLSSRENHTVIDYDEDTSKWYAASTVQTKATNRFGSTNLSFEDIPSNISTFGKVAWLAFGDNGIHGLDIVLVILFLGIIVAYEDAVLGFIQDTPFTSGYKLVDAIVMAVIVGTLSLVPDMGYLAKASASGLFVLGVIFIILATYSFTSKDNQETSAYDTQMTFPWDYLWPQDNMSGISNWFGCVVFGFGVVPLTYNFQESMSRPQELTHATAVALLGVAVSYIVLGCGLLALYYPVQGDILEQFPTQGILPLVVRLSMIVVIVLTSPLLVLPCGKILEEKLSMLSPSFHNHKLMQAIMRYGLCTICAIISVFIPGFVYILSFVGCFSVALVGFVIPPMIHISLVMKYHPSPKPIGQLCLDVAMLLWGIAATIISSLYTFRKLF